MAFQVFQNGKPCSSYGIRNGWEVDTFSTQREAEVYAYHWSFPMTHEHCLEFAPKMQIGKEYNYSQTDVPLMMKIIDLEQKT